MNRYYDLNTYFQSVFGCRVHKITVDAGFTCPNRDGTISRNGCIFCNSRGSGTGAYARGESIARQLEAGKQTLARRFKAKKFIAYFQAHTNTYAPVDRLKGLYDEALAVADVAGISVGTRPDCVNDDVLDLLQSYTNDHMVWVEYGVQSARDETLALINRGHDFACVRDAVKRTRNRGILTCAHMILGLPGEERADMVNTARQIADLGFDGIKLHLQYVVAGTALARMYHRGGYQCLARDEYADLVCDVLAQLPPHMVVQRLTGDPHPDELVAPMWALYKQKALAAIKARLEERDIRQGQYTGG
ncbi:MAG: TIGR01212 family radical SAM protein [Thermodesulfobacteriota bacterium]|nr:TIGR01212 family radical SAM protein [Thermodesulfobacteriota bacterium]